MTTVAPETVTEVSEGIEPREPERSESALVPASEHYLRIEPSKGWVSLKLRELSMSSGFFGVTALLLITHNKFSDVAKEKSNYSHAS